MNSDSQLSTPPAGSQFPAASELARQFQDGAQVSTPVQEMRLDPSQDLRMALDHNAGLQQLVMERDRAIGELREGEFSESRDRCRAEVLHHGAAVAPSPLAG